jgi:hypothetical protein
VMRQGQRGDEARPAECEPREAARRVRAEGHAGRDEARPLAEGRRDGDEAARARAPLDNHDKSHRRGTRG